MILNSITIYACTTVWGSSHAMFVKVIDYSFNVLIDKENCDDDNPKFLNACPGQCKSYENSGKNCKTGPAHK